MLQDIKNKVTKLTGKKYLPQEGELQQEGALQYLFVLPTVDGGGVPVAYTQNFDENGKPKPLNHQGFLQQWHAKEKNLIEFVAKENGIDPALLYGIVPDAPDTQKEASIGQDSGVTLLQGGIETTGVSDAANAPKKYVQVAPDVEGTEAPFTVMPAPPQSKYTPVYYTGPMGFQKSQAEEEAKRKAAQPQPNLFYISKENIEKNKDVVQASPTVVENNYKETEIEKMDVSATAAIASHILATNFASRGLDNMANLSDEAVGEIIEGYFKSNDIALDQAQIKAAVKKVRSYKPETNFPSSKTFDPKAMTLLDRVDTSMLRGSSLHHETWWQYRNERIGEYGSNKKYNTNSDVAKAIEFYQDPEAHMNTALLESKEEQFQLWLADMKDQGIINKNDNGYDYDYRGYWQKYIDGNKMEPVLEPGMHFPDEFKKPNHPTFSKESIWARGAWEEYAGTWDGETYTPGRVLYPRAEQDIMREYIKEYQIEPEDLMFSYGIVKAKEKGAIVDKPIDGVPTGFASDLATLHKDKNVLGFAPFEVADDTTVSVLNGVYGAPVVAVGGQISNEVYKEVQGYNRDQFKDWFLYKNSLYLFSCWTKYKNSTNILYKIPGEDPITYQEMFHYLSTKLDSNPDEVLLYAFPSVLGELYNRRQGLVNKITALQNSGASEEEIAPLVAEAVTLNKEYKIKMQALQNEFFHGGHTRIAKVQAINTIEEAIASGNIDTSTQELIAKGVRKNFNLAWGLHDQILGTDSKVSQSTSETEKSVEAKGYQVWAAFVPEIVNSSAATIHYYNVINVNSSTENTVKREDFLKARRQVEGYFSDLLTTQVKAKGDAFGVAVKHKFSDLIDMYTYLGFAKGGWGTFDSRFVEQEVSAFKDIFIVSDKYNVVIDKDSAKLAGISDVTQLDALLMYAKEEAVSAVDNGFVVVSLGYDAESASTNEALRKTSYKIQPVLFGDTVFFLTSGEENNHQLFIQNKRGVHIPYTMNLSEIIHKKDYDAKYYEQLSKEGFALKPRQYVEELVNPDTGLHPGLVTRKARVKEAYLIKHVLSPRYTVDGGNSPVIFDEGYYNTFARLQRDLLLSPLTKNGVTTSVLEERFLYNIYAEAHLEDGYYNLTIPATYRKAPTENYASFFDIPIIQRAYYKTLYQFTEGGKEAMQKYISTGSALQDTLRKKEMYIESRK